jgi:hypothetical protein
MPPSLPFSRFGLSTKLFAVLLLLGAIAVLISGGLGYVSARDALEQSIYNQLIAARETKTHQLKTTSGRYPAKSGFSQVRRWS